MNKLLKSKISPPKSLKSFLLSDWERFLPSIPQNPGVYLFLSSENEVLYVGKAKKLKNRISSYQLKGKENSKSKLILEKSSKLKYQELKTEFDAIITEAGLIKAYQPKYNIRLKDDKSSIYIVITSEKFPRILLLRKTDLSGHKRQNIFGPFSSSHQTSLVIKSIRRIFPFCNSQRTKLKSLKPCFYYHLHLCPGVCIDAVSQQDYLDNINNIKKILSGKKSQISRALKKRMFAASEEKLFERAARYRDELKAIELTDNVRIEHWREIRSANGREAGLNELWQVLVPLLPKSTISANDRFSRIEAYDISNISGRLATSAMCVFLHGEPAKKEYRHFRIKYVTQPDDFLMIRETLTRRLNHRSWNLPQLIIVDGGKGQVSSGRKALASYGLHHRIPLIGLAKEHENIVIYNRKYHYIKLNKHSPALQLLMHIRDEAHRFSKKYHRQLHEKAFMNLD